MAVYASLVSLARKLEQIHGDPTHVLHLHRRDFNPLLDTVLELQNTMENFPEASRGLEEKISDFANRADDIIDNYVLYLLRRSRGWGCDDDPKVGPCFDTTACFSELLSCLKKCLLGDNNVIDEAERLHQEMQRLSGEAASILVEVNSLHVQSGVVGIANMQIDESSVGNPTIPKISMSGGNVSAVPVGFGDDLRILRERLYGDSSQREIIPIVGMPGSGKTTLATALYEHSVDAGRFDRVAWITVSQNYNICRVLSQLLSDLKGSPPHDATSYKKLGVEIFQILKKRRFFIVIDDIWSENFWDQVKIWLPDDGNRSRILLTTRVEDVASYAAADSQSCIHKVELMDLDRSWSLLKMKVFGEEDCPVQLEEIGKAIAKNCGGLPLAIVVIAGVLSGVYANQDSWERIAGDVSTAIRRSDENEQVMEVLSLSYKHLPYHLKPCLLYLGGFPEDYEFSVSRLIMLWVAEGFLKKPIKSKRLEEEVAYDYLEDLVKKNLVLVSRKRSNDLIMRCRVHDLIRDLCVETARKERFIYQMDNKHTVSGVKNLRRLSISSDSFTYGDLDNSCLRSSLYFHCDRSLHAFMWSFMLLRVVDALEIRLSEFPSQVCQLFHLRYLAFTFMFDYEVRVPSTIENLQNLQVLRINLLSFIGTFVLPLEVWKMSQLRHLIFRNKLAMLPDPPSVVTSFLQNLQTLDGVDNFRCSQQVLQMIPNIRKLGFYNSRGGESNSYCLHNLVHLLQLETINIGWSVRLENIQLPQSLKKLNLMNSAIPWEEIGSIAGSLPNLEVLKLRINACYGVEWETREEEFPKLKVLEIDNTDPVIWRSDDDSLVFPRLERLCLRNCYRLKELPCCFGEIESLVLIEIDSWDESLITWARKVEEEQISYGNELLQIRLI